MGSNFLFKANHPQKGATMTTTNSLWEVQKAMYAALTGDVTLSALIHGVYSHTVQDTVFPYVKFGDISAHDWFAKNRNGIEAKIDIEVLSQGRGAKETFAIIAEIKRILNGSVLSLSGCTMISMLCNESQIGQLSDGLTWRGVATFNVLVEE